jgi:hypothetical protein
MCTGIALSIIIIIIIIITTTIIDLGEVGWGDVDWISLSQDRNRWRSLVNSVLNLRVP